MTISRRLQLYSLAVVATVLLAVLLFSDSYGWRDLLLPAIVGSIAGVVLASLAARGITRPLEELRDVTRSLATGDLSTRPSISAGGEVGELSTALHRLAEQLGGRIAALQSEDALLTALIESLNEGVVAFGPRQQAIRINTAARDLLRISDPVPFPMDRLPRIPALQHAIQSALKGAVTEPRELAMGDRVLSVTSRPLAGGGAVLALFDLTRIRQLEVVRRDFVANVSHELRTPLTVISGFAETLAEDDVPEESRRHFASTIRAHTARMQRIVDDLLDLSRLESGRWAPDATVVDSRSQAEEAVATAQAAMGDKELSLRVEIGERADSVFADRTALRQIISNLVENAVRHTTRGSVTVFAERGENGVWVGVDDTGPGIPPEHLGRIFERFYRVDTGRGRESGGTGLGLAIVKHLAEAHGGRVSAASVVGKETRIAAFFPDRANL